MNKQKMELTKEVLVRLAGIYLKKDDNILFVVDEEFKDVPISEIFSDDPHDMVRIPKVERPGQDYELDEKLIEYKTVAWLITSVSISHSQSTKKMIDGGLFLISNPNITSDWPLVLTPEAKIISRYRAEAILRDLIIHPTLGGQFTITDPEGNKLTLKIPAHNWMMEVGEREGIGTNGPFGELANAPYDAEGIYVLNPGDFVTNPINRLTERIVLTIKNNVVVDIQGGSQASQLIQMLAQGKNGLAYCLGEFAIGLNLGRPENMVSSVIAEKLAGGMHLAIGSNHLLVRDSCPQEERAKLTHGIYNAGVHIDCISFNKTVKWTPDLYHKDLARPEIILWDGKLQVK